MIDLTKYEVIYNNRIYRCITLDNIPMPDIPCDIVDPVKMTGVFSAVGAISVITLNEDGEITFIRDEVEKFQFIRHKGD